VRYYHYTTDFARLAASVILPMLLSIIFFLLTVPLETYYLISECTRQVFTQFSGYVRMWMGMIINPTFFRDRSRDFAMVTDFLP